MILEKCDQLPQAYYICFFDILEFLIVRPSPTEGWPNGSFEPSGPPRFSKILIF